MEGPETAGVVSLVDTCALFAPGKAALEEDLEPCALYEEGMWVEEGLVGLADTAGRRERRWIGGGTKEGKVGLSESPTESDMSARCIIQLVVTGNPTENCKRTDKWRYER